MGDEGLYASIVVSITEPSRTRFASSLPVDTTPSPSLIVGTATANISRLHR